MSDVISSNSYGNPGIGSCGVGVVSEGGVIGFGDEELLMSEMDWSELIEPKKEGSYFGTTINNNFSTCNGG